MDYILRISGDFKKGECWKCPIDDKYSEAHSVCCYESTHNCPLEEVGEDTHVSTKERAKAIAFDLIADAYKLEKAMRGDE